MKVESSKTFKKIKKFSKLQTCFGHVLGKKFGSSLRKFSLQKSPKWFVQTCFEHVLGRFFEKVFLPSVPWRVEFRKFSKKIKNFSKLQKSLKSFPKFQTCFGHVLGNFFEKIFLPSVPWRVESSKIFKKKSFQNSKNAQIVPKSVQTCFE